MYIGVYIWPAVLYVYTCLGTGMFIIEYIYIHILHYHTRILHIRILHTNTDILHIHNPLQIQTSTAISVLQYISPTCKHILTHYNTIRIQPTYSALLYIRYTHTRTSIHIHNFKHFYSYTYTYTITMSYTSYS